jgi:hypothetical protein
MDCGQGVMERDGMAGENGRQEEQSGIAPAPATRLHEMARSLTTYDSHSTTTYMLCTSQYMQEFSLSFLFRVTSILSSLQLCTLTQYPGSRLHRVALSSWVRSATIHPRFQRSSEDQL